MNNSLWLDYPKIKNFPKLNDDLETDVLVVGGGITGIICALLLLDEGFKVTIIEANKIFHGSTGNTTAKVTIQHGLLYNDLITKLGYEKAQMYADSNTKAIELIKRNIKNYEISCDYETVTSYIYTQQDNYVKYIEKEYDASQRLNIESFITEGINLPFKIIKALGFKNQGHFHVTKYLAKLVEEIEKFEDSFIFEHSKVINIKEDNNFCHTYLENEVKIKSRHVIVASHYPCYDLSNFYFTKLQPSTAYIVVGKYHIPFDNADYINIEKPVRSIRTQEINGERLLILCGENHQTGCSKINSHYKNLELFGKEHFKMEQPLYKFSTQDYKTFDKLPYIGRIHKDSPNIYLATGFKKWGMTTSHVAGMVIRDLIVNKKTDYEDLYNPHRLSDKLTCKYFNYNLNSIKHLIGDRLKKASHDFNLDNDEGKIVSYKGKKYGAYKDKEGELFIVDAICPHLKCILTFNKDRKTFDCPCHGSRFTYKGEYIDGPSIKNLKRYNLKDL